MSVRKVIKATKFVPLPTIKKKISKNYIALLCDKKGTFFKQNQLAELVKWLAVQTADPEDQGSNPTRSGS